MVKSIWVIAIAAILAPAAFAQIAMPQPKQEKLLNGLKVLMWPVPSANTVSVRIRVHSGSSFDPQGKEGLMKMLAENIFPEQAARDFFTEDLGGGLEINTTYDYIEIIATAKSENFLTMLETLAAAVANPTIDKATTAKLKTSLAAAAQELESDPAYVADQAAAARLFGTFPYGRPQLGSTGSLNKIDFADLIEVKQRFLTADNATVAVSGNFDRTLGFRAIRRYFGAWLKSDKRVPSSFRQPDAPPAGALTIPSPKAGLHALRYGMRGTARNDKDFAASRVFTAILEARLKARVPAAHAADVFVRNDNHILPGMITIGFNGKNDGSGASGHGIEANDLVAKALADPITETEFQAARSLFQAEWSKRDVYTFWLDADTFRLTSPENDARVADSVTADDVRAFAAKASNQPLVTVAVYTPKPAN